LQELEALPEIGPVLAGRIVAGLPYKSVEDLERIQGFGPKRLEKIKSLVAVE
jgi:competence protein ComEA